MNLSITERFARQAERFPDLPAVLTRDHSHSYGELAARVAGIAGALRDAGAGPGTRVGLLLDHGIDTVAGILGTLWTGAAYVPLDTSYPRRWLASTIGDAEAVAVVTSAAHRPLLAALTTGLPAPGPAVIDIHESGTADPPEEHPSADSPAYLLYTSGSTGAPKGVVQTHRNVLFQVRHHTTKLHIGPRDRISVLSSFGFDMAVTDLFSALLTGAAAVPVDLLGNGLSGLGATLTETGVTIYHSTPTVFRHLLDSLAPTEMLPSLRAVLLGGEALTWQDVERSSARLPRGSVLINGYGATEISFAAQHHIAMPYTPDPARSGVVPVGTALDGVAIELLAPDGEIVVRSRHVAAGYWRDEVLTERKFLRHDDGTCTYRTGDLGRLLPDGTIAYLGRADRQIKVRGYRVEPGDVEAVLRAHPSVGAAAVGLRPHAPGSPAELVAYVVPAAGSTPDGAALRRAVLESLPRFMVPGAIVLVDELPMTPTGKVDLAVLAEQARRAPEAAVPPRGPVESLVAAVWCEALDVVAVGREDNFFEIGGHSLRLGDVQRRLEAATERRIPLTTLLAHPTVAAQARLLAAPAQDDGQPPDPGTDRLARRREARARRGAGGAGSRAGAS